MTIRANFTKTFDITNQGDVATDRVTSATNSIPNLSRNYTDGTGALQANKVWRDLRTLSAGASETIDLSGTLTDHEGNTVAFVGVKEVLIGIIGPDGTKKLQVGNAASNSFQGPLSSGATEDVFYQLEWTHPSAAGFAVTNSSNDNLKINNPGAGSVTYFIMVLGD